VISTLTPWHSFRSSHERGISYWLCNLSDALSTQERSFGSSFRAMCLDAHCARPLKSSAKASIIQQRSFDGANAHAAVGSRPNTPDNVSFSTLNFKRSTYYTFCITFLDQSERRKAKNLTFLSSTILLLSSRWQYLP